MDNQEFCVLFIQLNHDSMDNLDELLKLFPGETITSIIEKALKIFMTDTPVKKVKIGSRHDYFVTQCDSDNTTIKLYDKVEKEVNHK